MAIRNKKTSIVFERIMYDWLRVDYENASPVKKKKLYLPALGSVYSSSSSGAEQTN